MTPRSLFSLVKQAAVAWNDNNATTIGAALAYYTVFSLAPLLLLAISMASLIMDEETARKGISHEIRQTLGPTTAEAFTGTLDNAYQSGGQAGITIIGVVTLLVGASTVFVQLQNALNVIWKTEAPPVQGNVIVHFIKHRLLSFTAVLGTGFLLLVSLVVSSVLAAFSSWLTSFTFIDFPPLWHGLSLLVSFGFIALMFALIFKLLPDAAIDWRDVWVGAALTALLFALGQFLIGLYLGQASVASSYGAAGSLVVLLVWVYYSAQLVLFGAEFTHAYAQAYGSRSKRQAADRPSLRSSLPQTNGQTASAAPTEVPK